MCTYNYFDKIIFMGDKIVAKIAYGIIEVKLLKNNERRITKMSDEVKVVEEVSEGVVNGNFIKIAAVILGIGAIIGAGYGIKKLLDKKKEISVPSGYQEEKLQNSEE